MTADRRLAAKERHFIGSNTSWGGIVADVRRAASRRGRERLGRFLIEGTRLHERALRAGVSLRCAVVARGFARSGGDRAERLLVDLEAAGCELTPAPDPLLEELTEGRDSGRILGLVDIPRAPTLEEMVARSGPAGATLLVAVEVEDPGNAGALVRTAHAAGACGFVAVGLTDPFHPRAARTSMGSLFRMPTLTVPRFDALARRLGELGIRRVGAVSSGGELPDGTALGSGPVALCMGSEAFGLDEEAVAAMDLAVSIPMAENVDSFSVNAATAILLWELGRRSRANPHE